MLHATSQQWSVKNADGQVNLTEGALQRVAFVAPHALIHGALACAGLSIVCFQFGTHSSAQ